MTIRTVVFYEDAGPGAGRILSVFRSDAASVQAAAAARGKPFVDLPPTAGALKDVPQVFWVEHGVVTPCQAMAPVWTAATQTLSGLAAACTVRIDGEVYAVTDGEAVFGELVTGDYAVTVQAVGFLPCSLTVTV